MKKYLLEIILFCILILYIISLSIYLLDTDKKKIAKREILIEYRSKYGNNWDSWPKETVQQFKNEMQSVSN